MANAATTSKTIMLEERASLLQHAAAVAILSSCIVKTNLAAWAHPINTLVTALTHALVVVVPSWCHSSVEMRQ